MRFIRIVTRPFAPRDARLERVLTAIDAHLGTPIVFEQGVFMTQPLPDRAARMDEWLNPSASAKKTRAQPLSNGRPGDELALFTAIHRTDRRENPGVPIAEMTLTLGKSLFAADRLEALLEAASIACDAFWSHGFHGDDQQALAALLMDAQTRTGTLPAPPVQTESGQRLHAGLGWIGYFNAPTAKALGFGNPDHAYGETRRAAEGSGWMYRLTPEALDLSNPAHRERVDSELVAMRSDNPA